MALSFDEKKVIISAKNAKKAFENTKNKDYKKPILMRVPKKIITYIRSNR